MYARGRIRKKQVRPERKKEEEEKMRKEINFKSNKQTSDVQFQLPTVEPWNATFKKNENIYRFEVMSNINI